MFGCGGESKIVIFFAKQNLKKAVYNFRKIYIVFNKFVKFPTFCAKFIAVVLYSNISIWESSPTANLFLKKL